MVRQIVLLACILAGGSVFSAEKGVRFLEYGFDDATGRIAYLRSHDGRKSVESVETRYFTMTKSGDVEAFESEDRVLEKPK